MLQSTLLRAKWIDADDGSTFEVKNPARGDVLTTLPDLGVAETRLAIEAAEASQKAWAARTGKDRSRCAAQMERSDDRKRR